MENIFKQNVNNNIQIIEHIYFDGVNNVNKPYDIIMYIKKLEKIYKIKSIYYADDCEFFHSLLSELRACYDVKYEIISVIPKNNGLKDVNTILEEKSELLAKTLKTL